MFWNHLIKWQPAPVFLPGKPHGQRYQAGYSPLDCKELDTSKPLSTHARRVMTSQDWAVGWEEGANPTSGREKTLVIDSREERKRLF